MFRTEPGRRRGQIAALPVALATAGLLAGCGNPVRLNGVEVDKEVGFLTVVEQQWRGDERGGADPYASTAKSTSCWLTRDRSSGAVQATAFCGPIRHLTGETPDGVFDRVSFQPEVLGDQQVQVDPATVQLTSVGVPAPDGLELYSPSAGKPADPEDVPTPEAPQAAGGLVTTVEDTQVANATVPTTSLLIAPNLQVSITKTGTIAYVPGGGDQNPAPYYRAAEGEEFVAFTVRRTSLGQFDDGYVSSEAIDLSAAYTVRSAASQVSLTGLFADDTDGETTVVASVPAGQDAELIVGVAGHDQTMSVRTGQRTSTAAEAYYRSETRFAIQKQYSSRITKGDFNLNHGVTFTDATARPFDPSRGWAPAGQMYLTVHCQNVLSHSDSWEYGTPSFNTKASVTATTAENDKVALLGGFPSADLEGNLGRLTFLVPAHSDGLTIRYQPSGTFAVSSPWGPDDVSPDRGNFTLRPLSFTLKLR